MASVIMVVICSSLIPPSMSFARSLYSIITSICKMRRVPVRREGRYAEGGNETSQWRRKTMGVGGRVMEGNTRVEVKGGLLASRFTIEAHVVYE